MKQATLKQWRIGMKLTQEQLEERSGVSQTVISKIERGAVTNPEFDTVKKLARALHIHPGQLHIPSEAVV